MKYNQVTPKRICVIFMLTFREYINHVTVNTYLAVRLGK